MLKKPKSLVITHSQRCFYGFLLFFKNQNGSCPLSSLNNLFLDSFFYQEYLTTYIPVKIFNQLVSLLFQEQTSQLKILTKIRYKKPIANIILNAEKLKIFQLKSNTKRDYILSLLLFNMTLEVYANVVR